MLFSHFREIGLCVIPLRKGIPQTQWSNYYESLPSLDECNGWDDSGHKEYALVCGKPSKIIALDIDTDNESIINTLYTLAGPSPMRKLGSKGFTAFYRYCDEQSKSWGGIVEVLSDKRLTTIPPSPHRKTGKPYVWMDNAVMDGLSSECLPFINKDIFIYLDAKFPQKRHVKALPDNHDYTRTDTTLDDASDMLDYISPDCGRDDWIQVGMALRDEFGDAACHLWHSWSAKAPNRYKHNDAQAAWRSFGGSGVTIGTLVYLAKQGGWMPKPTNVINNEFTVDLSYLEKIPQKKKPASESIRVSGLVGAIADWITETAIRPQPVLSLGAAIAFVGMMKGHRVRGHSNLRTNILAINLAPSAGGKEHPQQCIDRLAVAVGLDKHFMGRPTSGTGLLTGIHKAGGISLLSIDELGRFIGNIAMKSAGGYQREITDYMVELFSAANRTFRGRQYANDKQNPQIILQQPHFCCLGSTVPERLQAACTATEVIDGFLNRWLVFSANDRPAKQYAKGRNYNPPESLISQIQYWQANNPLLADNYGVPNPKEITFTPEAWQIYLDFESEMSALIDSEPYPMNQLYVRSHEHAEKLAMILTDDDVIGCNEIRSAISIVKQSCLQIVEFASSITDTQHEADLIYVQNVVNRNPSGISRNRLTQQTRRLTQRQRSEILNQLIESGDIFMSESGKKIVFFPSATEGVNV